MNAFDIQTIHRQILNDCSEKSLRRALRKLRGVITESGTTRFLQELEEIETNYRYLLNYFGEADDPQRDSVFNRLISETILLADKVNTRLQQQLSNDYYYQQYRIVERLDGFNPNRIVSGLNAAIDKLSMLQTETVDREVWLETRREYETRLNDLFMLVWLSSPESGIAPELSPQKEYPVEVDYMLAIASFFNLLERFTPYHFHRLLDNARHHNIRVQQGSLVCLFLALYLYRERVELSHELTLRVKLLLDDPEVIDTFKTIQLQLLQSKETEKISKRLNEEIFPDMIKFSSQVINKLNVKDQDSDEEKNPEWQSILDDTSFGNKMQELSKLQMEGADIHMSAFATLKNSPFFTKISNWFLPFNLHHSSLFPLKEELNVRFKPLMEMLEKSGFLCNSDKYSLSHSLMNLPTQAKEMFSYKFTEESEELSRQLNDLPEGMGRATKDSVSKQFIHDLYRFLKLFPYKSSFHDLFADRLDLYRFPLIEQQLTATDLKAIAEYLMENEHYDRAVELFELIEQKSSDKSSELYQRKGFCYQKQNRYEEALNEYHTAELIDPKNRWTLRKIAQCYKKAGSFDQALHYYLLVEEIAPDSAPAALNIGYLYLETRQYEKALNYFYKVEFLGKEGTKVLRAQAWTLFLIGRYQASIDSYNKLVENAPTFEDYLNLGHAHWAGGNLKEAIRAYRFSIQKTNREEEFVKQFLLDKTWLLDKGIAESDLFIMLDKLIAIVR